MVPLPRAGRPVLGALLVLALAAGVVGAAGPTFGDGAQPAVVTVGNTSGVLQPAGASTERRAYVYEDVDVSAAVADDVAQLRAEHARLTVGEAVEAADGRTARLAALREGLRALEERVEGIQRAQRDARRAYLDGSLSRTALVQRLARIDARAEAAERVRSAIERRAVDLSPQPRSIITGAQNLEATLAVVGGPATRRVRGRLAGNRSAGAAYVSVVGSHGLVVATVADGRLYRDAIDATKRNPNGTDRFAETGEPQLSVALRRAAALYPWTFANGGAAEPLRGYGDTAVYRITAEHTQGRLSAYFDGATEQVFRETQHKRLAAVPVLASNRADADGLTMVVNATHDTGPLHVAVRRADGTGPVDATVRIDGTPVGTTGSDGELWTVQPDGAATITARSEDGRVVEVSLA